MGGPDPSLTASNSGVYAITGKGRWGRSGVFGAAPPGCAFKAGGRRPGTNLACGRPPGNVNLTPGKRTRSVRRHRVLSELPNHAGEGANASSTQDSPPHERRQSLWRTFGRSVPRGVFALASIEVDSVSPRWKSPVLGERPPPEGEERRAFAGAVQGLESDSPGSTPPGARNGSFGESGLPGFFPTSAAYSPIPRTISRMSLTSTTFTK
jgi:hypothetical protein